METIGGLQRRLTRLYTDTKQSCEAVTKTEKVSNLPELLALHLEFRIQRERLSAWGLEWSDDNASSEGSIDEAVAEAGVTEPVGEVLQNIHTVLEEAERISSAGSGATHQMIGSEKTRIRRDNQVVRWSIEDRERYEQLAKDLRDSIDLLYDLSKTRRAFREGTYPTKGKQEQEREASPPLPPPTKALLYGTPAFSESADTLVNPTRASTTKTASSLELPTRLDPTLLELPAEQPPPYDRIGATLPVRVIAYLKQPTYPSSSSNVEESVVRIPVLVEFAPFDPAYRATGVAIPNGRLNALLSFYGRASMAFDEHVGGNLSCLGFFEDTSNPRFGLVYELPKSVLGSMSASQPEQAKVEPTNLFKLLKSSSKAAHPTSKNLPPSPPLEDRFRMAFNLVYAFKRMHSEERFTHKNVHSANVIFFPHPVDQGTHIASQEDWGHGYKHDVRTPYITSFDLFTEFALERPDSTPGMNIYRNTEDPFISRQTCGTCSNEECKCFPYRFDIHGLALILLEVGLWLPIADLYKPKYTLSDLKKRVEGIWLKRLRSKSGSLYAEVVRDMLLQASTDMTEESQRNSYQEWMSKLARCCQIDNHAKSPEDSLLGSLVLPPQAMRQQRSWSPKQSTFGGSIRNSQATQIPFAIHESDEEDPSQTSKLFQSNRTRSMSVPDNTKNTSVPSGNDKLLKAANTIQRAWRSRQDRVSFQEYRRKVSVIQTQWRKRTSKLSKRGSNINSQVSNSIVIESEVVKSTTTAEHTFVHIEHPVVPTSRPKLRVHNVKLQPEVLQKWHSEYQPGLEKIVMRALRHSPESCSIEIHMVGETPVTAKPTVFVTCSSISKVRSALARKWTCDPAILDVKIRRGKIRRSKATKPKHNQVPHRSMANDTEQMPLNPYHQQRPLCGASIGAFTNKHLPPVSFGGVVDVDGELYGMTVHHLLDDPSDDEEDDESVYEDATAGALRSSGRRTNYDELENMMTGFGENPTLQRFPTDSMFPFEISDDEEEFSDDEDNDTGYSSDESSSEDTDDSGTQGDIGGIIAGSRPDIRVTQPALDDVEDEFFPCPEDRDEDHLDSHELGHVYASSGIKRWNRKGVLHEIDWALLKLNKDRLQPCNLIQGGKRYCRKRSDVRDVSSRLVEPVNRGGYQPDEDEFPTQVAKSEQLSNLSVHCFGRTSGLQGGVIGNAMASVRIYKRRSFSRSWFVMGDFGVGGDSGAWVIDNDDGRVCGHVLAWCSRNSIAYICPADVLLDDMKRTLNADRIGLPGDVESMSKRGTNTSTRLLRSPQSDESEELSDLARLNMGEPPSALLRSRLNGSAVSPRLEMLGLYGQQIAR
ncbi:hypothetical protein BT63DRAFT_368139 [Microthyrium microscopicum]|uniref:Protein kinase domain-containing protein n=1 Tax=Microthyrium microscopicum TaxID=703497 RepID=A0A6A6UPQ5_9PEZI|nr:hypothetical protein BT63DRAFT_368139 [Microthyrium microscopicum]